MFEHVKRVTILIATGLILLLSACSPRSGAVFHDPFERLNRATHAFNKGLDRNLLSPVSKGYTAVVPDPVENGISNFASNLSLPGKVVNNILQLDISAASSNTFRFVINSTFGLVGLFDPSGSMGFEERDADFGQTLQLWGVGEGAYAELPVFGPSNMRDGIGLIVDMVLLDPASYTLKSPVTTYRTGSRVGEVLQKRQIYGAQIDEILYKSADSYAQSRLVYLQNRRFQLKDTSSDAYIDPYSDLE